MTEVMEIDNLTFDVRRSKRRSTIGITIERNASLLLHLPDGFSLQDAEPLVRSKLVWVHQKLISKQKALDEEIFRRPEFVDGEGFYFLGRHYRMKLVDPTPDEGPVATVRFRGDRLCSDGIKLLQGKNGLLNIILGQLIPTLTRQSTDGSVLLGLHQQNS